MSTPLNPPFHPWHHISNENMPEGLYKAIIEIPDGTTGIFIWKGKSMLLKPGRSSFNL